MLIHLPVVENRIAQFAARFEPRGAGWIYHDPRLDGGVPVSEGERAMLVAEHAARLRRSLRVLWGWLPVAIVACVAYQVYAGGGQGRQQDWIRGAVILLPMPWVLAEWWRADRLAIDLVGRRVAVASPRGRWAAARSRLAAMPASVPVMLVVVSVLLAVQSRPWATTQQRLWLAQAVACIAGGAWMLWMRRRVRR